MSSGHKTPRNLNIVRDCVCCVSACIEEDTECNKDRFGYEAIQQLHRLIDDDRNGNVDQSESDEVRSTVMIYKHVDSQI